LVGPTDDNRHVGQGHKTVSMFVLVAGAR
jgi:hypothetical protein